MARGFTYVEVLVTLALLGMLFVPTMQLFSTAMDATTSSRDMLTALALCRREMERVKNLGISLHQLTSQGTVTLPPPASPPLVVNGQAWRIERRVKTAADPVEVIVEVRRDVEQEPLVSLVTLVTESSWGPPRPYQP
ncbi:MAG TPA: type II secretion system protein [bacterium]